MSNSHFRKYLHDDPTEVADEATYKVQDGVIVDADEELRPTGRTWGNFTRFHIPSKAELAAEEAAWAAKSGPVIIKRAKEAVT